MKKKHLAEITGQDVKTIETSVVRLREADWIVDTEPVAVLDRQVIVYRLNTTQNGELMSQNNSPNLASPPKRGILHQNLTPRFSVDNSPRFSGGTPRFSPW